MLLRNLLVVTLFAASLSSCYPGTVWNIKLDQFSKDVHSGNVEFLKNIDFSKVDLGDISRLGDNAPYYMSYVMKKVGRPVIALRLLELEWQRGSGIWQKQAAKELITYYLQTSEYAKAEELSKQAFSTYPERYFYRQLLEAWYWQHKDENVLTGLERIASFKNPDGTAVEDRELALFRAVSSYRLDKPGWQSLFITLFSEQPASQYQIRAYEYFKLEKIKSDFSATDWAFMEGKYDIAKQDYGPALTALRPLITSENPLLLTPWDLRDLGEAYIGASAPRTGAAVFRKLVSDLLANAGTSESLYAAYETLGDLYHAARYYADAGIAYRRAIGYAPDDHQYDRMAWYIIDSEVHRSPAGAVSEISKYASQWHDPRFFDDVLNELCTDLIQRREWSVLWKLYHELDGRADDRIVVRVAYDVASAIGAGYIEVPNSKQVSKDLLEKVVAMDADRYYTFLAAARLDKIPRVLTPDRNGNPVQVKSNGENTDWENFIMGFVSYNLFEEAYANARGRSSMLSNSFIRLVVEQLHTHGKILESLRLMDDLVARPNASLSESDLKLYYPQPYSSLIEKVARTEKISLPVMYGMVREESYFDASITSSAGAVGLTQLMPATAKDIAHRMGMKDPAITDPSDNLAIGAHYLSTLITRFHDIGEALFAYNAGYNRVERWKAYYPGLPDDLFLEAVPFNETQGYVKKILVSAVAYGYLYYGMSPRQIVKEILPTF